MTTEYSGNAQISQEGTPQPRAGVAGTGEDGNERARDVIAKTGGVPPGGGPGRKPKACKSMEAVEKV
jgi:hypothetical protein